MISLIQQLAPIPLLFLLGLGLKHFGFLNQACAQRYLGWVVNVGMPAVILASVSRIDLSQELLLFPLLAMATVLVLWGLSYLAGRVLALPRQRLGVFVVGGMIMNLAFVYPFISIAWGSDALAWLVLFDFGNGLLRLTLVYGIACWFGRSHTGVAKRAMKGVATFPPFWALFIALALNVFGWVPPDVILDNLQGIGQLLLFLVPFSLGIYFSLNNLDWPPLIVGLLLRSGVGLLLGLIWVNIFDLEGLSRAVVLVASAAPVGFNTLVFAVRENLDAQFAASLASLSVLIGMFYTPVLIYLLV
ncbi:AEC family transporter [Pseudomonadota bacterium]